MKRSRIVLMGVIFFAVTIALDVLTANAINFFAPSFSCSLPNMHIERLRVPSSEYHHGLARNSKSCSRFGHRDNIYWTNNLGFRDRERRTISAHSDGQRIIFIGDSFTEGVGIDFQDTFAGVVADDLETRGIEVLNAAAVSYSPAIYYRKSKYIIEKLGVHFDRLVVFLDISDIEDEAWVYSFDENDNVIGSARTKRWMRDKLPDAETFWSRMAALLKDNSLFIRVIVTLKDRVLGLSDVSNSETDSYRPKQFRIDRALWTEDQNQFESYGQKGLKSAERNMTKLLEVLNENGIQLSLAVYPWPDQIAKNDLDSLQVSFWRDWTQVNGVDFIDLFPCFIKGSDPMAIVGSLFLDGDVHWNEAGHRVVADAFLRHFSGATACRSAASS